MNNYDALKHPNVQAMLHLIRHGEGTADANGYRRLVGGGEFDSFDDHPRRLIGIKRIGVMSSAAGAYQILQRTWDSLREQIYLPDFSPESQDIAAVQLIRGRKALNDTVAGRVADALQKLSYEWASLPPHRYNKQGTMTTEKAVRVFAEAAGYFNQVAAIQKGQIS